MKTERLGTFEEWYKWEMKARDSKKTWHYPTRLDFDSEGKPVYRTLGPSYGTNWDAYNAKHFPVLSMTEKGNV